MKFESAEEFELHVHKCFGRIFELLTSIDAVVKEGAEKEEAEGRNGVMCDLRDWIEEAILHAHLAWQYHRLAKGARGPNTWERLGNPTEDGDPTE